MDSSRILSRRSEPRPYLKFIAQREISRAVDPRIMLCFAPAVTNIEARGKGAATLGWRVVDWFWRGSVLGTLSAPSPRSVELARRARTSEQIARVALTPAEPLALPGEAIVSELYRQSAYWSACALAAGRDDASESSDLNGEHYSPAVWESLDAALLASATESGKDGEALRASLASGSFVRFAELPANQQHGLRLQLRRLAEALLVKVESSVGRLNQVRHQRLWRIGGLLLVLVLIIGGAFWLRREHELRSDLLVGKSWQASSSNGGGCTSPAQVCPEAEGFFFHTQVNDASPWIQLDLGSVRSISAIDVVNRTDCCAERAANLVAEVSEDGKKWKAVARQQTAVPAWHASFATEQARWLRIRIAGRGTLHLSRVRAYP